MAKPDSVKGEARQLLLDAAEVLFAEHGVDAVSLRNINAAAGVSPGVLHYHFGSREVLVVELITRHMDTLVNAREARLNALEEGKVTVSDIMAIMIEPLAELAISGGDAGRRYVRFIARLYADRSPILEEVSRRYLHVTARYPALLKQALPQEDQSTLDLKLEMANHAQLQMLADLTRDARPWLEKNLAQVDKDRVVSLLLDFCTHGLQGQSDSSFTS